MILKQSKMRTLEQVLAVANASYNEEMKKNPQTNDESGRANFVLGYLGSAYEELWNEYNALRIV